MVDLRAVCLGEVVGAAVTLLWTFGAPSWLRRGGVFSGVVGKKELGVLELVLLVFWGWRRAGGSGELCWV